MRFSALLVAAMPRRARPDPVSAAGEAGGRIEGGEEVGIEFPARENLLRPLLIFLSNFARDTDDTETLKSNIRTIQKACSVAPLGFALKERRIRCARPSPPLLEWIGSSFSAPGPLPASCYWL